MFPVKPPWIDLADHCTPRCLLRVAGPWLKDHNWSGTQSGFVLIFHLKICWELSSALALRFLVSSFLGTLSNSGPQDHSNSLENIFFHELFINLFEQWAFWVCNCPNGKGSWGLARSTVSSSLGTWGRISRSLKCISGCCVRAPDSFCCLSESEAKVSAEIADGWICCHCLAVRRASGQGDRVWLPGSIQATTPCLCMNLTWGVFVAFWPHSSLWAQAPE